ncbi:hypothetical protein KUTeg_016314, partial [Tegillarca granosa]
MLYSLFVVVTIFAGIELSKASAPDFMKYILMAYVGYQITVTLVLEIHKYFSSRKVSDLFFISPIPRILEIRHI